MATQTQIINLALQKLGLAPLISIADKNTRAYAMMAAYDLQRQNEIRAHDWKFAEKDGAIPADVATPANTYLYQYTEPTDCLRFIMIAGYRQSLGRTFYRTGLEQLYTIKGKKILTNLPAPLQVTYLYDVTDCTIFDANFVDMFACRLAGQTCIQLTQNATLKGDLSKEYKRSLNQALISGSIELPPQGLAEDSFILSRL